MRRLTKQPADLLPRPTFGARETFVCHSPGALTVSFQPHGNAQGSESLSQQYLDVNRRSTGEE